MKIYKKTLAILLAAMTCVSTMNVAVFADAEEVIPEDTAVVEETVEEAEPEAEPVVEEDAEEVVEAEAEPADDGDAEWPANVPEGAMKVDNFYIWFADSLTSDLETPYTGAKQKPSVCVADETGAPLAPTADFKKTYTDNLNVGTGYIYIKGLGSYAGLLNTQVKFKITPVNIPKTIKLGATSFPYAAGKAITPAPTIVGLNGKNLVKGTDYTVTYSKNKYIGTATVKVTGKGNYKSTATKTFKIVKCPASKLTIKLSKTKYTYTGKGLKPSVTVYNGKVKLSSKKYKVSYSNNVNPGTDAKVKVTMKDTKHYTGYKTVKFTIIPAKPVITKAEKTTSGGKIAWNKVVGADGYYLYRKAGNGAYKMIKKTTSLSYLDTSIKTGGSYTYYVVAYKGSLKSANSASKILTIKLPTPEITKAEPAKAGGIRLLNKVSGAQRYEIYRCPVDGSWSMLYSTTDAKELADYTDKTAKKGKTYDYQIIAWSNYNSKTGKYDGKAYSNIVRATCTKTAPINAGANGGGNSFIIILGPSEKSLKVMWDEVEGIEPTFEVTDLNGEVKTGTAGYEVQWSPDEDFENAQIKKVTEADPLTHKMDTCVLEGDEIPDDVDTLYVRVRTFQTIDGTTSRGDWGDIEEYNF